MTYVGLFDVICRSLFTALGSVDFGARGNPGDQILGELCRPLEPGTSLESDLKRCRHCLQTAHQKRGLGRQEKTDRQVGKTKDGQNEAS